MSWLQNIIVGFTIPPTALGIFILGKIIIQDLETFYFHAFPVQIKQIKMARALVVISMSLLSLRYLLEAIFYNFFENFIKKSLNNESFGFEVYLLLATLITEVFAYIAILHTIYKRKCIMHWVKIEAGLEL